MTDRIFDVIILGATGFTGKLAAEYMFATYGLNGSCKWAVAGRSASKLNELRVAVAGVDADKLPQLLADSHNEDSLRELVASTRVVCTTVGPYALYGSLLVQLCAEEGTHYCDLTGELHWMQKMIFAHHATAEASGARIVHTCGFDSIPSDLGTLFMQDEMHRLHGVYAPRVKYRVAGQSGGVSGGTVASMINMMEEARVDPGLIDIMADPYALNPPNMPRGGDGADQSGASYDKDFGQWTGPFVMAGINTRVVRRTHSLLGYPWGGDFRYDEAVLTGDGPGGYTRAALLAGGTGLMMAASAFTPTRNLLVRMAPSPGEGPDEETIKNGYFEIDFFAMHPEDPKCDLIGRVTGDRDPGYGATAKMLIESAVCLAQDELSSPGGISTPAFAMGQKLVSRLVENAGMGFSLV